MRHNRISHKPLLHTEIMAICLSFCLALDCSLPGHIHRNSHLARELVLSFETIEQKDYSGSDIIYEPKTPGIIIVSKLRRY